MTAQPTASLSASPRGRARARRPLPYGLDAAPLLRSVTGSRLHGFAHTTSDHDAWVVVAEPTDVSPTQAAKRIFQQLETHADGTVTDTTYCGLNTFLAYVARGIPQALEALYSPLAEVDRLGPMRFGYRVDPHTMRASYRRMLANLVPRADEAKQRRHGFRLALNLNTALVHGRFNPRLTADQRDLVLRLATPEHGFTARLETFAGMQLTPGPGA